VRALIFTMLMSCGGSTSDPPATTPDAASPARVPTTHRAAAIACPATRPPGMASAPPGSDNKCTSDSECTAGLNGRCYGSLQPNICTYDECTADADCKAAVCDCRNAGALGQPNKCFPGNCRTDADCAGNYCSPSGTTVTAGCTGAGLGSYGYFCHTRADECIDDADCKDAIARCMFEPDVAHWQCKRLLCPR
jgi:hypothetical protein